VVRRKGNSQELIPERVIHFSRTDLQLYQEDMYDAKGSIQTTAIYGPMQTFGQQKFPGTVTIKRPLEELQIMITIQNVDGEPCDTGRKVRTENSRSSNDSETGLGSGL